MLTVSRSVDRVFQIMELFGSRRRPLSATEIRQSLNMPHSSAVSVLSRLVALGYLDQNAETKRFFPSLSMHRLCGAIPEAIAGGTPYAHSSTSCIRGPTRLRPSAGCTTCSPCRSTRARRPTRTRTA